MLAIKTGPHSMIILPPSSSCLAGLAIWTRAKAREIEAKHQPTGEMIDVGGYSLHAVHVPRPTALTCLHLCSFTAPAAICAIRWCRSGQCSKAAPKCCSSTVPVMAGPNAAVTPENQTPDGQAAAIARAMQAKGISRAIIIGHSFGGAIAASFALAHPEMTRGWCSLRLRPIPGRAA
jgi:pimeloyl-ACP methyl ester carboxylesterase